MEAEFGTTLFRRSIHGIELTEAGKIVYEKAKSICRLEEDAKRRVNDAQLGSVGTHCVSIAPSAPDRQLKRLFLDFCQANPTIQFEFYESDSYSAIDALCNGLSEIAVIRKSSQISPRLRVWYSVQEPLMVVFHNDTCWFETVSACITVADLRNVPLSAPRGLQSTIRDACLSGGFYPRFLNVCSNRDSALLWAQNGHAAAILPAPSARDCSLADMTCLPLTGIAAPKLRLIPTLRDRQLSPVAENFLAFSGAQLTGWNRLEP